MPIYEYCCRSCGTAFEELVRISSTNGAGIKCPGCGSREVERMLSSFSISSSGGVGSAKNCGSCSGSTCSSCG